MRTKFDWRAVRAQAGNRLTQADARLLDLLAEGKSTPQIAVVLGEHRSRVWRRSQKLKERFSEKP